MKRLQINENWKESWKYSYPYDLMEIYGEEAINRGYAYAYENRKNVTIDFVKSVIKKGDKILDVAAAQGNFSLALAELGYEVTWNDIREDLAEYVEMKREKGKIDYVSGNIFDIECNKTFDLILITEIIEHVAHPDDFLVQISRLVKPNGYIVMTTPLGSYFLNNLPKFSKYSNPSVFEKDQFKPNADGHIFLLHLDEIELLAVKANLCVKEIKYYTNPLTNGHLKMSLLLKILPKSVVMNLEKISQTLPFFIGKRIHNNVAVLFQKNE